MRRFGKRISLTSAKESAIKVNGRFQRAAAHIPPVVMTSERRPDDALERTLYVPTSPERQIESDETLLRPEIFLNRELSWLDFNHRVLEEAMDPRVPLLERLKFLAIFSSNLDEFFMIRVAGVWRQVDAGVRTTGPDGLAPRQVLSVLTNKIRDLVNLQHRTFIEEIRPTLEGEHIRILKAGDLDDRQRTFLDAYFRKTLFPVITPLAIDPSHPFPRLTNLTLCLVAELRTDTSSRLPAPGLSIVHIPSRVVSRFIRLPSREGFDDFILLENVIRLHIDEIFPASEVVGCYAIRLTRDQDIEFDEEEAEDLLTTIEEGLRNRRVGAAIRLQFEEGLPSRILELLKKSMGLMQEGLYPREGFIAYSDLFNLYRQLDRPYLKDRHRPSRKVPELDEGSVFDCIRRGDILLHHPYQDFEAVTRFLNEAVSDPDVLAIKMTLYRVSADSPVTRALTQAAQKGKQVAVLVELKARFDEEANIRWARSLEAAGAHVIYGIPGYKTHCKACLVVRQDPDGIRRYCHMSTGNYNDQTSRIYGDIGMFTCREEYGEDLSHLFNSLTGYVPAPRYHRLLVAPESLRAALVEKIQREVQHAQEGKPSGMTLKMNSLVDRRLIQELYRASRAGVPIELLVRGICCLRPGVPSVSETIRVTSIVDRFLEHARVFRFENGGNPEFFLSSADWMPRNLNARVETAFQVVDGGLQLKLQEILDIMLADTTKTRVLSPDWQWERAVPPEGQAPLRAQEELFELADRWTERTLQERRARAVEKTARNRRRIIEELT